MVKIFARHPKNFKTLQEVTHSISSDLPLEVLYQRLVSAVVHITDADACLIYQLDEDRTHLALMASKNPLPVSCRALKLKLGEGITGWVAKEKKPLAISQRAYEDKRFKLFANLPEDRYEAFLSVPMVSKNRLVGVINAQHIQPRDHDKEEVLLVWMVAQQVAGALENARLLEQARTKAFQLEALSQISSTVSSGRYLVEILDIIVSVTAKLMGSRICSVMLLDEKYKELVIKATQSLSDAYRNKPNIPLGTGISGKVALTKRPTVVADVRKDNDYRFGQIAQKEGLCSLLSVPMLVKDKVVGVINCYTSKPHRFNEDEIKVLAAIANQCAVAVENATLLERATWIEEELAARKWVERAKGILMKQQGLTEEDAYQLLRKKSMDIRKPMKEVAQVIVLASQT